MKYTEQEKETADKEIADFYSDVIAKLPGAFAGPFTSAEMALLRSFALYRNRLTKEAPQD